MTKTPGCLTFCAAGKGGPLLSTERKTTDWDGDQPVPRRETGHYKVRRGKIEGSMGATRFRRKLSRPGGMPGANRP